MTRGRGWASAVVSVGVEERVDRWVCGWVPTTACGFCVRSDNAASESFGFEWRASDVGLPPSLA